MRLGSGAPLLIAWLLWLPASAPAELHHQLAVSLDPDRHQIEVRDRVTLGAESQGGVEFALHPELSPTLVGEGAHLVELGPAGSFGDGVAPRRFKVELAPGQRKFELHYRGQILHPLRRQEEEYARAFRETPGTISPEGVFLSAESFWYPRADGRMLTFEMELRLPAGWTGMSQGERSAAETDDAGRRERWRCDAPQEEIYLIAGRFTEYRRAGDPVEALVLLREPDPALAARYLEATGSYVKLYDELIGPYPYGKFALVENFWETGYGMPSFTLLGPTVIRFPFILHSSYPHEILHNWWGNGVYVDYASGNWSEGLTSYLADHLIKEQRGEAVEYRRTALQKYTDYVRTEQDFPLTAFRSRHSASSEAVGYGKTLMLFHMLRLELGDRDFIEALRALYRQYRFRVADYGALEAVFSAVAKRPLEGFFAQWVERQGAPALRVSEARVEARGEHYLLTASIEQTQPAPAYALRVPVAVELEGRSPAWQTVVRMEEMQTRVALELPARPLRLEVDPEFDVFRRLDRAEIPPSVSQAMGAERVLIVLPSEARPELRDAYRRLAESWQGGRRERIGIALDAELEALPEDRAVWLFGWGNHFRREIAEALKGYAFADQGESVRIAGATLERDQRAVVVMARQVSSPEHALGWLAAEEPAALPGLGRKLPHYGRYSYLAFRGEAPENVLEGQWPVVGSPLSVRLAAEVAEAEAGPLRLAPREPLAPAPLPYSRQRREPEAAGAGPNAEAGAEEGAASRFDPRAAPVLQAGGRGATVDIDRSGWQRQSFRHDVSPVDLSFLNHRPAGKHGFLVRRGEALEFEDGTPARFWGANVAAHAIFRPEEEIEVQARRLARLGYNLVRIHHHDSTGWVSPTVIDKSRSDTRELDAEGIASLDYWIKCLADQGVYVFLDLHAGRELEEGDRHTALGTVTTFDEMREHEFELKGFAQYEPTLQALMVEFQEKYLGHVNPHRGRAYKDDPAVVGLLLTNENDITRHFANMVLPEQDHPVLRSLFERARRDFAGASGLSEAKISETWLPGESKIFLNHQEHLFNQVLLGSLARLGVRVPVATTSMWGRNPSFSLPALTDGSLIDVHAYQGPGFLEADPHTTPIHVHWIAAAQVAGFPVSISEWNVVAEKGAPSPDRHAAPLFMAALGGLQGWDAPMLFNYSNTGFTAPTAVRRWSSFADPGLQAAMPAAALAFRQGHVEPGAEVYCLELDRERLYFDDVSPETSAAIRTVAERSRLRICLPDIPELTWEEASPRPAGAVPIRDPREDFLPDGKDYVESDTGQLRRYWPLGIQTINTAATQAALGKIGGFKIELGNVTVEAANPEATVVVSALDGRSIADSSELLITTAARVEAQGGDPYVSEPVVGTLTVETAAGKTLVPLAPDGTEGAAIAAPYQDGAYRIALDPSRFSHWYLLR